MVGKTFTYLLGSEAASLMFNSKNEDLNAEDVYSKLTTPVFGKGVAYDVPNPVSPSQLLNPPRYHWKMSNWHDEHYIRLTVINACSRVSDLPGAEEDAEEWP